MNLNVDLRLPREEASGWREPRPLSTARLATADGGSPVVPGSSTRPYSFLSECECPSDCLRDHQND